MLCRVCQRRKARRRCPALSGDICTVCCGTKRLTEIHCPRDCVYLAVAREHPAAAVRRQRELDLRAFLPAVQDLSEEQSARLWVVLSRVRDFRPEGFGRLTDDVVSDAAAALASTYETASRGVIYEHRAGSVLAQQLSAAITEALSERPEGRGSAFERDVAATLRAVERGVREARKVFPGDVTAYLGVVERLMQGPGAEAPEPSDAETAPGPKPSGLILP